MSAQEWLEKDSEYLKFLPVIFHGREESRAGFTSRCLKIFEKILSGIDDAVELKSEGKNFKGISETLDSVSDYFYPDPEKADFLDWLASILGLIHLEGWGPEKKKDVIKKIIPLYRIRGTLKGLRELVYIFIKGGVEVEENPPGSFFVGAIKVGEDTYLGGTSIPYSFTVRVDLNVRKPIEIERKTQSIKEVIEREKPIHTVYKLIINIPTMIVGKEKGCMVGDNTLIGGTKIKE